jgi:hypothetical protein
LKDKAPHNNAQTRRHKTPLHPLDPLAVPYPLDPSLTLTLPHVLRYHAKHGGKSGSPPASPTAKTKTKEGQLFRSKPPEKEGKVDHLLILRERNQQIKNRYTTIFFWFLYYFLYTCFSTVVISQEINFITDQKLLSFFVFLFFCLKV